MLMAIVKEKLKIIGMAHNNAQVWLAMQMYDCDPNLALDYWWTYPRLYFVNDSGGATSTFLASS